MKNLLVLAGILILPSVQALAVPSDCETCHAKLTPGLVADFNRGIMSHEMNCTGCHGTAHTGMDDFDKAQLPTIATCAECHEEQANQ